MSAGEICIRGVDTARKNESVCIAARRMNDRNVGSLVVVDEMDRPIGIVTDRDLAIRVLGEAKDPHATCVEEVMSQRVRSVNAEMPVERALEIMRSGPFRRLPVIDRTGKLIGLLSVDDILSDLADEFRLAGTLLQRERPSALAEA